MSDTKKKKRAREIRSDVRVSLRWVLENIAEEHILDHVFEDCADEAELKIADAEVKRVAKAIRAMVAL